MKKQPDKIRICVDAIISIDNNILVCDVEDKSFTYLPGGGIEVGETIPEALHREIQEELQKDIEIGTYVGYFDQQFELNGKYIHEICHIFRVNLVGVDTTEPLESFAEVPSVQWVAIDELTDANLKPDILRTKIPQLFNNNFQETWHISQNEIKLNKSV